MNFTLMRVGDQLRYSETNKLTGPRTVLICAGLISLGASAFFPVMGLQMEAIDNASHVAQLLACVIGLLAFCAFAGYCLWLALFKPTLSLVFDARTRRITQGKYAPAMGHREQEFGFDELRSIELGSYRAEDGAVSYWLALTLDGRRPLELGVYAEEGAAMRARAELQGFLGEVRR